MFNKDILLESGNNVAEAVMKAYPNIGLESNRFALGMHLNFTYDHNL